MISLNDVRQILGDLDDDQVARVIGLGPTLADLEAALLCLDGEADILEKGGHSTSGIVARIVEIVRGSEADPADEAPRTSG